MSYAATLLSVAASAATTFWDAFWPNLASTLVGAAIGVPIGLLINRQSVRFTERRSSRAENELLQRTLAALEASLNHNVKVLSRLVDKMQREAQGLVKPLDTGTWGAVHTMLPSTFHDPGLLRRLAYYWVQLGQVTAMHHMILQQQLAASSRSPTPMLSAMQDECDQWLKSLLDESKELLNDLKIYLNNSRP